MTAQSSVRASPPGWATVALAVAALTLLSRVVGFGRSLVFSKTVGDTCLGDVYNAANTLPNTLFELVAGGVLAGVVVPVVARHVVGGRGSEAAQTVSALLTWTLLLLTVPAVGALAGAQAYAVAFTKPVCAGGADVLAALVVMFVPQIWLYGLAVVTAGVLQAHRRFLAAAAGPLLSSVVVIASYLAFATTVGPEAGGSDLGMLTRRALLVLGLGTTAGVLMLAMTSTVAMARLGLHLRPTLRFAVGDRRTIVAIGAASVAGLVMQQLSVLLISWVAQHTTTPGALTRYLWAAAIYLLPYAVLAAPLLQQAFPQLSAAAERGHAAVGEVLRVAGPPVTVAACLGAAALVATAVPVARVFVLGPGSGDTWALAWPIVAFGPAVVGFALLGLATRTLLAQHLARDAGVTSAAGWAIVIVAVLAAWLVLPDTWLVVGLGAAMSIGMTGGAVAGWLLARRRLPAVLVPAVLRPLRGGLLAAVVSAAVPGWFAARLADATLGAATVGAIAAGFACLLLFVATLAVVDRAALRRLWSLAGRRRASANRGG